METEKIIVRCPHCSAALGVPNVPGLERKNITCPVCGESSPFSSFRRGYADKEETEIPLESNNVIGQLTAKAFDCAPFRLRAGRNIVGRKASASAADFQIPVPGSRRLSREHLLIEVKRVQGKGIVHYVSLFKEKVNETRINGKRLEFNESIVLKHGDVLELPDVTLVFEIPDGEATDFNG